MNTVRAAAPQVRVLKPYDPKYIPSEVMISANENPSDVPAALRREIEHEIRKTAMNRYPDPLANGVRDLIAEANGLGREQVLLGNGGDELLFGLALAWGGPGRTFLNMPPTFTVYASNAALTNTTVVDVPRTASYDVDKPAVLERLRAGDVDFTIVNSPNNPTGNTVDIPFVEEMLNASDALVMVDEAYFEFSRETVRPLLETHENLIILRTFSKAFSLAGVRVGYVLGSESVIDELKKVRQPYSVDALSQACARVTFAHRAEFEPGIEQIVQQRAWLDGQLAAIEGVQPIPSQANYILFRLDDEVDAADVWQRLLDTGVLVRDFSRTPRLENCLRVSVGSEQENARFIEALRGIME